MLHALSTYAAEWIGARMEVTGVDEGWEGIDPLPPGTPIPYPLGKAIEMDLMSYDIVPYRKITEQDIG